MADFRTTTLTLAGAFGYIVGTLMAAANGLPFYNVPGQWILIVFVTSSTLLSVDFGIEVFGQKVSFRPKKGNGE